MKISLLVLIQKKDNTKQGPQMFSFVDLNYYGCRCHLNSKGKGLLYLNFLRNTHTHTHTEHIFPITCENALAQHQQATVSIYKQSL